MTHAENPAVKADQRADGETLLDFISGNTCPKQLTTGNNPMRPAGQHSDDGFDCALFRGQ